MVEPTKTASNPMLTSVDVLLGFVTEALSVASIFMPELAPFAAIEAKVASILESPQGQAVASQLQALLIGQGVSLTDATSALTAAKNTLASPDAGVGTD